MEKQKHLWWGLLLGWAVIGVACDPCNECGNVLLYEPSVSLVVINQDSADKVTLEKTALQAELDSQEFVLEALEDTFRIVEDSLEVIEELIAQGNSEYEDERQELSDQLESWTIELDAINITINEQDSVIDVYNDILSTINSGLIRLDAIKILTNGAAITYDDSMKFFTVPLLMNENEVAYQVEVADKQMRFSLGYELYETLNEARVFRVIATDIRLLDYEADTLTVSCRNDICNSNETTLTLYF